MAYQPLRYFFVFLVYYLVSSPRRFILCLIPSFTVQFFAVFIILLRYFFIFSYLLSLFYSCLTSFHSFTVLSAFLIVSFSLLQRFIHYFFFLSFCCLVNFVSHSLRIIILIPLKFLPYTCPLSHNSHPLLIIRTNSSLHSVFIRSAYLFLF